MNKLLDELKDLLGELPSVFRTTKPKPLKLHIYQDMCARYPKANPEALSRSLAAWVSSYDYHDRVARTENRYDLDCHITGKVSSGERKRAQVEVSWLVGQRVARRAYGPNHPSYTPDPARCKAS